MPPGKHGLPGLSSHASGGWARSGLDRHAPPKQQATYGKRQTRPWLPVNNDALEAEPPLPARSGPALRGRPSDVPLPPRQRSHPQVVSNSSTTPSTTCSPYATPSTTMMHEWESRGYDSVPSSREGQEQPTFLPLPREQHAPRPFSGSDAFAQSTRHADATTRTRTAPEGLRRHVLQTDDAHDSHDSLDAHVRHSIRETGKCWQDVRNRTTKVQEGIDKVLRLEEETRQQLQGLSTDQRFCNDACQVMLGSQQIVQVEMPRLREAVDCWFLLADHLLCVRASLQILNAVGDVQHSVDEGVNRIARGQQTCAGQTRDLVGSLRQDLERRDERDRECLRQLMRMQAQHPTGMVTPSSPMPSAAETTAGRRNDNDDGDGDGDITFGDLMDSLYPTQGLQDSSEEGSDEAQWRGDRPHTRQQTTRERRHQRAFQVRPSEIEEELQSRPSSSRPPPRRAQTNGRKRKASVPAKRAAASTGTGRASKRKPAESRKAFPLASEESIDEQVYDEQIYEDIPQPSGRSSQARPRQAAGSRTKRARRDDYGKGENDDGSYRESESGPSTNRTAAATSSVAQRKTRQSTRARKQVQRYDGSNYR
ncbi:hypothetical protein sr11489 [Sporisorium reilianum SRZ2]|uniref:Uncharacterized protein n=1 Tax=Sporisorium reilianum (strain SRZ2) TaxID=999809 RepID=E6ZJN6_SPORE|nr:hypothetical protein sr11489 [Sporisorium reilianum SRZ2]